MAVQPDEGRTLLGSRRIYGATKRGMLEMFRLLYRLRVEGAEHVPPSGPLVVAANHPSFLDPPILFLAFPREIRFMAWDRLFANPLSASCLRLVGAFPVDLSWSAPSTIKAARRVLESEDVLGIFPEGHRTRSERLDPLKRGVVTLACQVGAPIVPVTISGTRRVWGVEQRSPRLTGRVLVTIHRPIEPPLDPGAGPAQETLDRLRRALESAL